MWFFHISTRDLVLVLSLLLVGLLCDSNSGFTDQTWEVFPFFFLLWVYVSLAFTVCKCWKTSTRKPSLLTLIGKFSKLWICSSVGKMLTFPAQSSAFNLEHSINWVRYTLYLNTIRVVAGVETGIQGSLQVHSEFKVSLGKWDPVMKIKLWIPLL